MKMLFLDADSIANADLSPIAAQGELHCFNTAEQEKVSEYLLTTSDIIISNKIPLTAQMLSRAKALKLICVAATGYNNIDLAAAKKQGIAVTNVAGYSTHSVAQHVFALLLSWAIKLPHYQADVNRGKWSNSALFCLLDHPSFELKGKTLGIIGAGNIGQATAVIARAFGMHVLLAERANAEYIRPERTAFERVLQQSDVVSLHCPLTEATEKMVNDAFLSQMKASAVLINTARGGLIDEQALVNALNNQNIAAALLDGLAQEPPSADNPLLIPRSNLLLTPHTAWASKEARQSLVNEIAENIRAYHANEMRNRLT